MGVWVVVAVGRAVWVVVAGREAEGDAEGVETGLGVAGLVLLGVAV